MLYIICWQSSAFTVVGNYIKYATVLFQWRKDTGTQGLYKGRDGLNSKANLASLMDLMYGVKMNTRLVQY